MPRSCFAGKGLRLAVMPLPHCIAIQSAFYAEASKGRRAQSFIRNKQAKFGRMGGAERRSDVREKGIRQFSGGFSNTWDGPSFACGVWEETVGGCCGRRQKCCGGAFGRYCLSKAPPR